MPPPTGQTSSIASDARLVSPCVPSADARALTGSVAVFYWSARNSRCVTVTLVDAEGHVSTVTTPSISQDWARFVCQDATQSRPTPGSGLTPGPAYSVSNDRVYWWDGHLIRWLSRDGSQGSEVMDTDSQVGLEFAVSPDDGRMVITTIDFGRWPLHRVTWIEDVATHDNKAVLFDGSLSTDTTMLFNEGPTGWPWGWHDGRPVLYEFIPCATLGGDQFFASYRPRLVDPSDGSTLVSFPECFGGTITPAGVFCTSSSTARSLDRYDWTGRQVAAYPLPFDTFACDSDVSPSGSRVLAYCLRNIYTDIASPARTATPARTSLGKEGPLFLFGSGPALPTDIEQPFLHWLTDDLIIESRSASSGSGLDIYFWSLNRQAAAGGPIRIAGSYADVWLSRAHRLLT